MAATKVATQHTPGPWAVRNEADYAVYEGGDHPHTVASNDGLLIARISLQSRSTEANARLIAAAPELLSALQNIVDAWLSPLEKRALKVEHCEAARAAIAKAVLA